MKGRSFAAISCALIVSTGIASAANVALTGHDDDYHCTYGSAQACAQLQAIVDFVRSKAPDPSKPVLSFDHGIELTYSLSAAGIPFVNIDPDQGVPASANFDVKKYSAIVVASDQSCSGCDNDSTSSGNLAGAAAAIAAFFDSGGGIAAFAGAHNLSYYAFVPTAASGFGNPPPNGYVQTSFGAEIGIPAVNGDPTHNFFYPPGTNGVSAAYSVVETLGAGGQDETIACSGCGATEINKFSAYFGPSGTPANPTASTSEPVNTATGNYYLSHSDLQVPGRGMSFNFVRSYNSRDPYSGPLGIGWTHSFNVVLTANPDGSITIKQGSGAAIAFSPSGGGAYTPSTAGVFDTLAKNSDDTFTLTRTTQLKLHFSAQGKLISMADRNGNTQTLSYDGLGNLTEITDASSRTYTLDYDGDNHLTSLTDPSGRSIHYSYDSLGRLISFRDALGNQTTYAYDDQNRLISATDPRGNVYLQNVYDPQGRVIAQTNANHFTTTFAYDTPSPGATIFTDPLGNTTRHVYDANLRIVSIVDANGGTVSYTYDSNNLKTSVTDPLGHVRKFTYDARGNVLSITDPADKTSTFTYDERNDLLTATDRLGRTSTFTYDANGNLLSAKDPADDTSSFTYDSSGQVLTATNPRGFTTSFQYDDAGDLADATDALGGTVQMSYDGVGRVESVKNPLGKTTTRAYDADNRLLAVADPLGDTTRLSYDPNGNLTAITDANGKITQYFYDATNKLSQLKDAAGGITTYTYNGNTDLIAVTDADNHKTAYSYDPLRRLSMVTDPLGREKQYSYDADGDVTESIDGNGNLNRFGYDELNRLVSMVLSDGKTVHYTDDAVGNRLTMADWHGTTSYVSDLLNRITSVTTPDGKTVGYTYDAAGNRKSLTTPDGQTVQYTYDAANRLIRVAGSTGTTTYSYDAAGNLSGFLLPNGAVSQYRYDAANRLLDITNMSRGRAVSSFAYVLDKVGNRVEMISNGRSVNRYGYDDLYRLTSWIAPSGQITQWAYDPVGNRTETISSAGTTSYTYDAADQLLAAGATRFTYDSNGNQLTKRAGSATFRYTWDALNRLLSVTGGATNTHYAYDGDGNRIAQQVPAGTYTYVNDVASALPSVLDESGPDGNIDYVYGLSRISASSPRFEYFYQFDGLGSAINITNQTGAQRAHYSYDPWGKMALPLDPLRTTEKYKFTGEASDPNDGLIFLRSRYYNPLLGRFIERDPIGALFGTTRSKYEYSLSNPLRFVDPSGLSASEESNTGQMLRTSIAPTVSKILLDTMRSGSPFLKGFGVSGLKVLTFKVTQYVLDRFGHRRGAQVVRDLDTMTTPFAPGDEVAAASDRLLEAFESSVKQVLLFDARH